jgi:hypothetical protein
MIASVQNDGVRDSDPGVEDDVVDLRVRFPHRCERLNAVATAGTGNRHRHRSILSLGLAGGRIAGCDPTRHFWDSVSFSDPPPVVVEGLASAGFRELVYRPAGGLLGEFRAESPDA